jgi:uncharacterized peroxidase-related enzyme
MFRIQAAKEPHMSFIGTVPPQQATGEVAGLYQRLQGSKDYLPNYARVFCHRPQVMAPLAQLQDTLKQHMSPRLWALIALMVAREIKGTYCALAFAKRLLKAHFTTAELLAIVNGQIDAPLTERERAAVVVAVKLARDSSSVEQTDIDSLYRVGFTDAEVFDIVAAAAWRCFFAKLPDALGADPDAELGDIEAPLLERLTVGRAIESEPKTAMRNRPVATADIKQAANNGATL